MSKITNHFDVTRAQNGGFLVTDGNTYDGQSEYMAAFSNAGDLIAWLSAELIGTAKRETLPAAHMPPAGRLESAVLAKPPTQEQLNDRMMAELDKLPRIRPVPPPEGPGK